MAKIADTTVALWRFAPEELEETGIARAHVVCSYRRFLEPFNGLVDHVADEGAFFFCHCCCGTGLGVLVRYMRIRRGEAYLVQKHSTINYEQVI